MPQPFKVDNGVAGSISIRAFGTCLISKGNSVYPIEAAKTRAALVNHLGGVI